MAIKIFESVDNFSLKFFDKYEDDKSVEYAYTISDYYVTYYINKVGNWQRVQVQKGNNEYLPAINGISTSKYDRDKEFKINWGAWGSQSIEETEKFADGLLTAVKVCQILNDEFYPQMFD